MAFYIQRSVDDIDWNMRWDYYPPWKDSIRLQSDLSVDALPKEYVANLPQNIIIKKAEYWPDFQEAGIFFIVTEKAKNALEQLEPNSHEYFKMTVDDKTGTAPDTVFLLRCTNLIQPIIINRSDVGIQTRPPIEVNGGVIPARRQMHIANNALYPKFVLDRNVIGGRHLWKGVRGGLIVQNFVSNAFKERLDTMKAALRYVECQEVDAGPEDLL